ncbi:exophilin-5 isoform X2 [Tachyglossus aculeatus]|nr:exophilin-5 isoform X2 [Tachyglossus aculeatus]
MLKPPLTHRLRKMMKNDPVELPTSRSSYPPAENHATSTPSILGFRSPFASFFSFRKSGKESLKPSQLPEPGYNVFAETDVPAREKVEDKMYHLKSDSAGSGFDPEGAEMREESDLPPWETMERELFRVLDDLDCKLAEEQTLSTGNIEPPINYGAGTQFSHLFPSRNTATNFPGQYRSNYSESSNMSIYDLLRPAASRESFQTVSYRTKTLYDIYGTKEHSLSEGDGTPQNTFGSSSLCTEFRRRTAFPVWGHFTASSLHLPSPGQTKSGFAPQIHRQSPKRTPLSSIVWNTSHPSGDFQKQGECPKAEWPMEVGCADEEVYPRWFQENGKYEFYRSKTVFGSGGPTAPRARAFSREPLDNSENTPLCPWENKFSRSCPRRSFGPGGLRRFRGGPVLPASVEEPPFWSDSCPGNLLSDRDFEMISTEANDWPSPATLRAVPPSRQWRTCAGPPAANVSKTRTESRVQELGFETHAAEHTDVSESWETLTTLRGRKEYRLTFSRNSESTSHSTTPVFPHLDFGGSNIVTETHAPEFGIRDTEASVQSRLPPSLNDTGGHRGLASERVSVTFPGVKVSEPDEPSSHARRDLTKHVAPNRDSVTGLPVAQSQPTTSFTQMDIEKTPKERGSEKVEVLDKTSQESVTSETLQPIAPPVISATRPDFQNSLSRDPTSEPTDRFIFNAPTTAVSRRSSRVPARRDISKIYITNRNKTNALKKETEHSRGSKLDPGASSPLADENRTRISFPSLNRRDPQGAVIPHGDFMERNEENRPLRSSGRPPAQSQEQILLSQVEGEKGNAFKSTTAASTVCSDSRLHPPGLSPHGFQGSLPTFSHHDSPLTPSLICGTEEKMQPTKSPLVKNEEKTNSSSLGQCPFSPGKGKGKVRRRVSCIEQLSKPEKPLTKETISSSAPALHPTDPKSPEPLTVYCTLPRKSPSFFFNAFLKSEKERMPNPVREGPPPFRVRNDQEDPAEKPFLGQAHPPSTEAENKCPDGFHSVPAPQNRGPDMSNACPVAVSTGPPPFQVKRTVENCSEAHSLGRADQENKSSVSRTEADSSPSAGPAKAAFHTQGNLPLIQDFSLPPDRSLNQETSLHVCSKSDNRMTTSETVESEGVFSLIDEKHSSEPSEMSEMDTGNSVQKYKTTSTFTISGDEDNVKCLELVSIYYTLPRRQSRKICHLFQGYTQNRDEPTKKSPEISDQKYEFSIDVADAAVPIALGDEGVDSPTQILSGTTSSDLKTAVSPSEKDTDSHSQCNETAAVLQLPSPEYSGPERPSEQSLQESAVVFPLAVDTEVSHGEKESNSPRDCPVRAISEDSLNKTIGIYFSFTPTSQQREDHCQTERVFSPSSSTTFTAEHPLEENPGTMEVRGDKGQHVLQSPPLDNVNHAVHPKGGFANSAHKYATVTSTRWGKKYGRDVNPKEISIPEAAAFFDCSCNLQPMADDQKISDKKRSDSQSKAFPRSVVSPAKSKHQPQGTDNNRQPDLANQQTEPKQSCRADGNNHGFAKQEGERDNDPKGKQTRITGDQGSLSRTTNRNKSNLACPKDKNSELEKRKNRPPVKNKLEAMPKGRRKFSTTDISSRRHVASIFPRRENGTMIREEGVSLDGSRDTPLSPNPISLVLEITKENQSESPCSEEVSSLVPQTPDLDKNEPPVQNVPDSSPNSPTCGETQQNTAGCSKRNTDEGDSVTDSPPKGEDSRKEITERSKKKEATFEKELETQARPILDNLSAVELADHQTRPSPPSSLPFAADAKYGGSSESSWPESSHSPPNIGNPWEWEPEPSLYRSKSLKNLRAPEGKLGPNSQKSRERHFSEEASAGNVPSSMTLGNEFPIGSACKRRFQSFSEVSCDENDKWAMCSQRTGASGPRSVTYISRPIDYGIFGKEQQLAFLENVKRSLTEGRLWRPCFLKNPGFLKDDLNSSPHRDGSLSSASPFSQGSVDGLSPREPLNIYQDVAVDDSDADTDTTTDDEYYLDEIDKESEL